MIVFGVISILGVYFYKKKHHLKKKALENGDYERLKNDKRKGKE